MSGPIMIDLAGTELTDQDRRLLEHDLTGGVILFTRNFENRQQVRQLIEQIHSAKSPSLIVAVDQEGGRVQRFKNEFTLLPAMRTLGQLHHQNALDATQYCEDLGWLMACELRTIGVDLNFAPVIDLDHGCSDVIGDRAFAPDRETVVNLAKSLIGGLRSAGISTCAKHYPGHGAVMEDSHLELPTDQRPRELVDIDLQAFKDIVAHGVDSIMTAHLIVTCEAPELVSFSPHWIKQILRKELGYTGVVFSDDLSMKGADTAGGIHEKVVKALRAGCQFLPICNDRDAVLELYQSPPEFTPMVFDNLRAQLKIDESVFESTRYRKTRERIEAN